MSDPVTNAEIEDVLSSIRRLVSEEPLGERRAGRAQGDNTGKLVLTPALRVAEVEEQDGAEAEAEVDLADGEPDLNASEVSEGPVEASMPVEADAVDAADEVQNIAAGQESDAVAEDAPQEAHPEEQTLERHRPTGLLGEDAESTLQRRVAELEAALQQVPDEWEPDGSETEFSDDSEPLTLEEALSEDVDDAEESSGWSAEQGIATDDGSEPVEIEAIAALVENDDIVESADETELSDRYNEIADAEFSEVEPAEGAPSAAENASAEDTGTPVSADVDQDATEWAGDIEARPEEGAADTGEEAAAPLNDSAIDAMFEEVRAEEPPQDTPGAAETAAEDTDTPVAVDADQDLTESVGDIEALPEESAAETGGEAIAPLDDAAIDAMFEDVRTDEQTQDTPSVDESDSVEDTDTPASADADQVSTELVGDIEASPEDMPADEPSQDAEVTEEPVAEFVDEAVVEPAPVEPEIEVAEAPSAEERVDDMGDGEDVAEPVEDQSDASPETLFDIGADETLLDEEALRDIVSTLVREELQGVLGERITRNVRRLVRREIQRAMALRDLE